MYQSIRERHKRIFDTWSGTKSLRETARTFGISEGRVYQIVKLYKQRLLDEQNMDSLRRSVLLRPKSRRSTITGIPLRSGIKVNDPIHQAWNQMQ